MEEHKKNLKITSYVIIILAIFNIVLMGISFATGELRENAKKLTEESISQTEGASEELGGVEDKVVDMAVYGTIGVAAVGVLFDVYLGIAGLRQANGTSKGKANIILATIVFGLALIGLIPMIISMTKQQTSISSIFSSVLGLIIMFYYIRYAKKVVEEK